ncbi:lipopolysaccharide assembly protein LapA domain-containing protein [Wenyingzhuangia sp. IMCC45533]
MRIKTFIALFFIAIIVIFSIQNAEVTDVKFLTFKLSMSRVLVILGSFVVGLLVGILSTISSKFTSPK